MSDPGIYKETFDTPERFAPLIADFYARQEYKRRGRLVPYILWGYDSNEICEGKPKKVPTLHLMDCSSGSGQVAVVERCHKDGMIPLEFCFPTKPQEQAKLDQLGFAMWQNKDDFHLLAETVIMLTGSNRAKLLEAKLQDALNKNAAMEAEIAKFGAKEKSEEKKAQKDGK